LRPLIAKDKGKFFSLIFFSAGLVICLFSGCKNPPQPPPEAVFASWGLDARPGLDSLLPALRGLFPAGDSFRLAASFRDPDKRLGAVLLLFPRASAGVVAWEEAQNYLELQGSPPRPVPGSLLRKCVYAPAVSGAFRGIIQFRGYLLAATAPDTLALLGLLRQAGRAWAGKP
jgi:hypothetical protein